MTTQAEAGARRGSNPPAPAAGGQRKLLVRSSSYNHLDSAATFQYVPDSIDQVGMRSKRLLWLLSLLLQLLPSTATRIGDAAGVQQLASRHSVSWLADWLVGRQLLLPTCRAAK